MRRILLVSISLGWFVAPARAQEAIPSDTLREIKGATVFVKTRVGTALVSGSGFVMRVDGDTAFVVTNHHVVSPPSGLGLRMKPSVSLVFGSGSGDERTAPAEILATDPSRDLAVLRVKGVKPLPRPLDLLRKAELGETIPVYIFGFPFGERLSTSKGGPAITVGRGSISSLRLDDLGRVAAVQIDGALNPGNSGGPVVDARGRLVGIAVATIRGANNIGLAIPPDQLSAMFDGRVGDLSLRSRVTETGDAIVTARASLIDPLGRMREVTLRYARADASGRKPKPNAQGVWPALARSESVDLKIVGQQATGEFKTRAPRGATLRYWVQTSYTDGAGKVHDSEPAPYTIDSRGPSGGLARRPSRGEGRHPAGGSPPRPTRRAEAGRDKKGEDAEDEDEPVGGFARTTPPEPEPKGGFSKPPSGVENTPRATKESLVSEVRTDGDVKVTEVKVSAGQVPRCLFWSIDGKSFIVLERPGTLRRVGLDGFREEMRWDVGRECSWVSPSAEGLLLSVSEIQEVWVLEPKSFRVKSRIAVPSVERAVSSPALSVAFAVPQLQRHDETLSVIDLKKGEVVREYGARDFRGHYAGFLHPAVTPDGKYLFAQGGIEALLRFRIRGNELRYEEASERIATNGQAVEISPDGYYVSLPAGGGNRPGYITNVYKITNLSNPEIVIKSGAHPRALGFDIKAGFIFAQNYEAPLILFRPSGIKYKEYTLSKRRRQAETTRQFAVHPDGGKLLLLSDASLAFVELPSKQ